MNNLKRQDVNSLSEDPLNEFNMVTHWLIRLSKVIGDTSDHELQKVLRFNRWHLGRELDNMALKLDHDNIEYPFCSYLTAKYASNESEIREFERALDGKDKVWDASGTIQSPKEIKQRLKDLHAFRNDLVRELCPECRKEAMQNYCTYH